MPPSPFEAWFVSSAHDEKTIARVAGAIGASGGTPEQDQVVAQAGAAALGGA